MIYTYPSSIPECVSDYSDGLQKIYIATYNQEIVVSNDEKLADDKAWIKVKESYYFDNKVDSYLPIKLQKPLLRRYDKISECPVDVQKLPDDDIKRIWMVQYNNAALDGDFKKAKDVAWKAIKNFIFYHIPTCTWKRLPKRNDFAIAFQKAMKEKLMIATIQKSRGYGMKKDKDGEVELNGYEPFECHIPLQKDKNGSFLFIIEKINNGKSEKEYFLKGEASNTKIDWMNDRVSPTYVKKMVDTALGLTVFSEHKHDTEHTLGYISNVEGNEQTFVPTTHLENPDENSLVRSIVAKTKHGTKLFYSIHGGLTKIATTLLEGGNEVRELLDGFIDEVTITAWPAGKLAPLTFAQSLAKSLSNVDKTIETTKKQDEGMEVKEEVKKSGEEREVNLVKLTKALETIADDTTAQLYWAVIYNSMNSFYSLSRSIMNNMNLQSEVKKEKINKLKTELDGIIKEQLTKMFEFIDKNPNEYFY